MAPLSETKKTLLLSGDEYRSPMLVRVVSMREMSFQLGAAVRGDGESGLDAPLGAEHVGAAEGDEDLVVNGAVASSMPILLLVRLGVTVGDRCQRVDRLVDHVAVVSAGHQGRPVEGDAVHGGGGRRQDFDRVAVVVAEDAADLSAGIGGSQGGEGNAGDVIAAHVVRGAGDAGLANYEGTGCQCSFTTLPDSRPAGPSSSG